MTPEFLKVIETISYAIESVGVFFIVVGLSRATFHAIRNSVRERNIDTFHQFRVEIGRAMLVGLEFLVAGDVIRTVIVSHSLEAVASLGLVVLIRTVLVFTIELEVNGRWPWQPAPTADVPSASSSTPDTSQD